MAWEARSGLKLDGEMVILRLDGRLNGLGSPFGIETDKILTLAEVDRMAKWPGKPVRD